MSNADIYHEMIIDYSRNPINYGEIEDHDVTFHDSNPLCGDSIDIDMKIDDNKVSDIKFHGKGCAICMACSSVLTEIAKGKDIDEVKNISKNDVLGELGLENLQAVRIKCALLSLKVLKFALYSYLGKHIKDSQDVDKLKEEAANLY
ncbi:MAG: iron-sulfur cluster assembly scaffold protein [Nitrosopumilaceae archaeon]|jgi:nitrogen fixation NifU-like protein|uniref:Iron-sulfur cluster assembly scaffold protein n=3 Tax=Candidatus Nitrosomaritimum aestuariumsis TaxID=3342354 RepID=A0AC60VXB8_9ARCH|nr:iron-sulfur cluster assembly scaffold protein [Nitrosopumilaceae archaeon]MBA4460770.1 iron-sulfur cluster assembly scaffold protein [Nitrosopumilaceae archaeon]MBA4461604.1 iron-sulfur cluster assembly scaffold protein [Nitrosopumilaceae archaeon]MBA4464137.1 iron-sulfur cluster assembly scaffold protein [Nitrosopumilaceae archaeon]NCF21737.1 Fe-S cluster protein [Nitrosopumilaceae archaeon]